ncbi:GSCFA domain-containing protein [Flavobacterium sp.]|uniref:GSCFA domain-containing protein n=1 Tax=Flavobacterium sp. TaxID=239 RepID=UPI0008CD14F5|nr:GSCFA domain-containing protein [Flavobacterium sp.]OGS61986.1 MAG: GSCFA domain-containing protein [Flavobacteria bacterium GWF1_32_7]HBD27134.1 GSCFA domain-containing protein [Flavobacterium sp.]
MQFTTKIPIQKSSFPIDYDSKIMLLGSCFAENMAEKFDYFKFQAKTNPFGIIFNPVSLEKLIRRSVEKRKFTENDIFFHNELWHCYEVHSELSNADKDTFLNSLNELINSTHQQLNDSTHIIITLGTSWVYRNIESNEIVANCHKVPQKKFTKELQTIKEIKESLENIISLVHSVNPNCKFIFTVSPVRHIKDGFVENNLSKAHLIAAIHQTITHHPSPITYFPSYEIMMDELRDYRFYAEDMLHPNQTAIDYIWIQFFENYISESEFGLMNEICSIQKGLQHRPFNPNTESHQKFLNQLDLKIKTIQNQHPFIKFC